MSSRRRTVWILVLLSLITAASCTRAQRSTLADPQTLDALERGQFVGDILIDTDGTLGGGFSQRFDFGPSRSHLAAHGQVNFGVRPSLQSSQPSH